MWRKLDATLIVDKPAEPLKILVGQSGVKPFQAWAAIFSSFGH
jgi:hypothetical protein